MIRPMTAGPRARLAELIKSRRRELRLSEREAAERGGLARNTWASAEAGNRQPAERTAAGIEVALEWAPGSVDRVLAGGDPVVQPTPPSTRAETTSAGPRRRAFFAFDLEAELERIRHLDLPAEARLRLIRDVLDLYEEVVRDGARDSAVQGGGAAAPS